MKLLPETRPSPKKGPPLPSPGASMPARGPHPSPSVPSHLGPTRYAPMDKGLQAPLVLASPLRAWLG